LKKADKLKSEGWQNGFDR